MKIIKSFEDTLNKEQKEQFNKIKEMLYRQAMAELVISCDAEIQMELHKVSQVSPISKEFLEAMKNVSDICKRRYSSLEEFRNDILGLDKIIF